MALCPRGHTSDTDDFCDECGLPMDGSASGSASSPVAASPAAASPAAASSGSGAPASGSSRGLVGGGSPGSSHGGGSPGGGEPCPWCGTPRNGRFCEEDGYDFVLAPGGPAPGGPAPGDPASDGPAPGDAAPGEAAPSPSSTAAFPSPTSSRSRPTPATPTAPGPAGASPAGWAVRVEADRRYFETVLERRGPDIETVTFPTYYPRTEVPLAGAEMRIGRRRASSPTAGPEIDLSGPPLDPGVSRLHAVLLAGPSGWSVLDPGSTNGTTINYADEPIATDTPVPVTDGDRIHVGAYTTLVVVHGG